MIPCEECIVFAICKHKSDITCDAMYQHMLVNYHNLSSQTFWKIIRKTLPEASRLIPETSGRIDWRGLHIK